MPRRRLLWFFLPALLALNLISLLVVGGYAAWSMRRLYYAEAEAGLEARARLTAAALVGRLNPLATSAVDSLCKELGRLSATRLTVVSPDGRVLGDSARDPRELDNHAGRPEIAAALAGQVGRAIRESTSVDAALIYVAVPLATPDGRIGAVRAAVPMAALAPALRGLNVNIALIWIGVTVAAVAIGLAAARWVRRLLGDLAAGADRFARGELQPRLVTPPVAEVGTLADAMNRMAAAIEAQLRTIQRQLNEQDAVLQSMMEGVLAVDNDERLLRLNAAAARLLRIEPDRAQGRPIQEVVRNVELQRFVARVLASREPQEGELILRDEPPAAGAPAAERFMQAHGTVLRDEQGHGIGALVVLNDVTRLRRLENVRREFVANVSHELKTPITSIKGFVETLLDGAWQNPDDARRFLEIVARQSERLNAIIEDLLVLSSLEQETRDGRAVLGESGVCEILRAAAQVCAVKAEQKRVEIEITCPAALRAPMNAPLIEQAVVNLVDNAIKYSEAGQTVNVAAEATPDGLVIRVRDHGAGIAPEHLPRLFERFYRVDKGRSRQQGGTGLGLAIVKHIAKAHGGSVTVESKVGEGSEFAIRLPGGAPA